jgi:cobalt/nickel transport system permease protein
VPVFFGAIAGYIVALIFFRSGMDFTALADAKWFALPHLTKMSFSWQAIVFMAPEAAILVFTAVLLIQALFFGDGGITALGANVFNMAIVGGFVGLYTFKGLRGMIGKYPSAFVAAWLATLVAAVVAAIEMAIAGTFPLTVGIASMALYHAFIGIIEGVLTVIVLYALEKFRPDLLAWNRE